MHIATVPNRKAKPSYLLRETYREDGKVKNRTLANLSKLPAERIDALRAALRGDTLVPVGPQGFEITRSLPHGYVVAALAAARTAKLDDLFPRRAEKRRRDLALALVVARLLDPAAKLATARMLDPQTATHSLGETLNLGPVTARELYATLDWLVSEQAFIELSLARRHLKDGMLVLYDVTSTYLEGKCCELAKHGYSRDGRPDRPQLVIGLLCAADGCPVAVEVFAGNTADPATVASQISKLKDRFRLRHVALVGDRGMITSARIEQSLKPAGIDWITALRAPAIRELAADGGPLQPSLFDDRDMAEITSPDYPGERLVVCKNPLLAEERSHHREALLVATEKDLTRIKKRVEQAKTPLRGAAAIGQAVGAVQNRHKVAKHFDLVIGDASFSFTRNTARIAQEARLDGFYVLRTNLAEAQADAATTVLAYKSLGQVERAFRSLKTVDLQLRPVFHWSADRVRAHVLLCMLAYYLEWHMRQRLAPMLFDDHDKPAAAARRPSPVAKAKVSEAARQKALIQRVTDADGNSQPVHSFRTLIADLATMAVNTVRFASASPIKVVTKPTAIQAQALTLMGATLLAA